MITKFKIFETLNDGEPEVGDYVILNFDESDHIPSGTKHELLNNINKIIDIKGEKKWSNIVYNIEYVSEYKKQLNDIWYRRKKNKSVMSSWHVNRYNIEYWSKNKEDLEVFIDTKKYNL